jgi:hypothetical protein
MQEMSLRRNHAKNTENLDETTPFFGPGLRKGLSGNPFRPRKPGAPCSLKRFKELMDSLLTKHSPERDRPKSLPFRNL